MSQYKPPRIASMTNSFLLDKTIVIDIVLNAYESSKTKKEIDEIITQYVTTYESRVCEYGYIYKIDLSSIHIYDGEYQALNFDGSIKYKVSVKCKIFKPEIEDIIVGAKLYHMNEFGLVLSYFTTKIFVEKKDMIPGIVYKIGNKYNIKCAKISYELDKTKYNIIIKYITKGIDKDIENKESYHCKRLITPRKIISSILSSKDKDNNKENLEFIDYYNKKQSIPFKNVKNIIENYQIIIYGTIFYMYDIPTVLRMIEFSNEKYQVSRESQYNVVFGGVNDKVPEIFTMSKYLLDLMSVVYKGNAWEKQLKFLLNPYELLYPAKTYRPLNYDEIIKEIYTKNKSFSKASEKVISRAYYKLYEIASKFGILSSDKLSDNKDSIINIYTLGDAPGGCTQAAADLLSGSQTKYKVYTTSLIGEDKDIIKYNYKALQAPKYKDVVVIDNLKDGTGNLLHIDNIKYLINTYGRKCSYVFGDAAIGYDDDKLDKEIPHTPLLLSELISAVFMNNVGGSCSIKLYRANTIVTLQMFVWLKNFYNRVIVYKPFSVRLGNSERFVVCIDHKSNYPNLEKTLDLLNNVLSKTKKEKIISIFGDVLDIDNKLLTNMNEYLELIETFLYELGSEMGEYFKFNKEEYVSIQKKYASENFL